MGNRCPNCSKFVSLEAQDPEVQSCDVELDGTVSAEVRLVLACAECGDEGKETVFTFEEQSDELEEHIAAHAAGGWWEGEEGEEGSVWHELSETYELNVEEPEFEVLDEYETKDRHGKPIRNFRYQKHLYGVSGTATVECSCGESFDLGMSDTLQASAFDENW